MSPEIKEAGFALIKQARLRLSQLAPSTASTKTKEEYDREFTRLLGAGDRTAAELWAHACHTASKRTYYRRTAAIRHGVRTLLADYLRHQDWCQRQSEWSLWQRDLVVIRELIELDQLMAAAAGQCPISAVQHRKSKRRHLAKFPADWRYLLANEMKGRPYEAAYLVSMLSGCRPQELESGVEVAMHEDQLTLKIKGAKVKGDRQGQETRELAYSLNSELVQRLGEVLNLARGSTCTMEVASKVNWTSALRRAGRKLWPGSHEVTPYLLRHALASDLKLNPTYDAEDVSALLGHQSGKTASAYGHWRSGRKGKATEHPTAISASTKIRQVGFRLESLPSLRPR